MDAKKTIAGVLGSSAMLMGVADVAVLNETPLERNEVVATERVITKQVGNVIETTFPWKDQPGIKVKYDLGEPTMAERFADKRKREVITETVTDFDGGFKVDILLNEPPDTNVFCYDIDGAENYDFFYQPPLTEEEIKEGNVRPPEIDGSYAVYHKTLSNHQKGKENYATGKVMHIPRPQVWSMTDVEAKVWADMTYSESEGLCVTVPQEFLAQAEYPVRVDPTFGYTTVGGTLSSTDMDIIEGSQYSIPENGIAESVSFYNAAGGNDDGPIAFAIYAYQSVNNATYHALLATTTELTTPASEAWNTISLVDTELLSKNKRYIQAIWGAEWSIKYDAAGTTRVSDTETYDGNWPNILISTVFNNRNYSSYITYSQCDPELDCGPFTEEFTNTSTTTYWTAPDQVDEVLVQCWGAGGGGDVVSGAGGGAGGGGAYASGLVAVTAGLDYPVIVGLQGDGSATPTAGGDSSFGTTSIVAAGGREGNGTTGGLGGSVASSTGTTVYAGGNGGNANTTGDVSGGGGGSAGPDAAGGNGANGDSGTGFGGGGGGANNGSSGNASGNTGGTGGNGGGNGGAGDTNDATSPGGGVGVSANDIGGGGGGGGDDGDPGGDGGYPGGGGGGGEVAAAGTEGGEGGNGRCILTYTIEGTGGGGGGDGGFEDIFWFN